MFSFSQISDLSGVRDTPYALVLHDLAFLIEPRWFRLKARWWHKAVYAKRLIREATWLFTVSERSKQDAIKLLGVPAERITVIPLGLSTSSCELQATSYKLQASPYVLALGASDPRKNIGCAIEAVRLLRQDPRFSDISLICAGSDVSSFRIQSSSFIISLRRPSDAALADLMKNAAAFLYPSWYEGYGLPLHEAARFGTPCIASTSCALPETAPAGTLFAPPFKPHLWTTALKMILKDPASHRTATALSSWDETGRIMAEKIRAY